jgi:hypothetical protein
VHPKFSGKCRHEAAVLSGLETAKSAVRESAKTAEPAAVASAAGLLHALDLATNLVVSVVAVVAVPTGSLRQVVVLPTAPMERIDMTRNALASIIKAERGISSSLGTTISLGTTMRSWASLSRLHRHNTLTQAVCRWAV